MISACGQLLICAPNQALARLLRQACATQASALHYIGVNVALHKRQRCTTPKNEASALHYMPRQRCTMYKQTGIYV